MLVKEEEKSLENNVKIFIIKSQEIIIIKNSEDWGA